jgi:NDP-sugar pyrophosphorylase family protein/aminoglycoside/choline kinase family phosphotransferase
MSNLDAVILSAGFGERLRPITNVTPKVLLPVLGKPILIRVYERLQSLNPGKIFINTHYLAEVVERTARNLKGVEIVKEPEILGTGGAIVNVARRAKSDIILAHNGDVLSDIDLASVVNFHLKSGADITLVVSEKVCRKNLVVEGGYLKDIGEGRVGFTGIAIYRKRLLEKFEVQPFDAKEIWLKALREGYKVMVFEPKEGFWYDIGTSVSYARAIFELLSKRGERVYVREAKSSLPPLYFDGFLVIEGEPEIERGAFLRNVILLDNVQLKQDEYKNCILSPAGIISFDEIPAMGGESNKYLVGLGGSDRKFWRVYEGNKSFVICDYGENKKEFEKHLKATEFLMKCGLPVPKIVYVDEAKNHIYIEDLGDTTLYSFFKYPGNKDYLKYYSDAVKIIARLHALGPLQEGADYFEEFVFDYEYFRWEQMHFINNFVKRFSNLEVSEEVEQELDKLANICSKFEKVILHRDYQSQNIMVKPNGSLAIVDFTGLRWGPKSYDLASLIFDPYMPFIKGYHDELLKVYVDEFNSLSKNVVSRSDLELEIKFTRLQRHMQALGAYGYLSRVKGKRYFEKYIMDGLRLLIEDLEDSPVDLLGLKALVNEIFKQLLDNKCAVEYNYLL